MNRKRFILWDNDGVLVETEPLYYRATRETLGALGVELPLERYMACMIAGRSAWELLAERGYAETAIEQQRQRRNRLYERYLRQEELAIADVRETLDLLSERYRMAVVTTCRRDHFAIIHRDGELLAPMEFVLTREDYTHSKPHPEPYLLALARFEAEAEDAVVIEDSARGLHAAMRAGIDCLIIRNAFTASHDFSGAAAVLESVGELPRYLGT